MAADFLSQQISVNRQGISADGSGDMTLKTWGLSRNLYEDEQVELVHIIVRRGGYSSRHKHQYKHNAFFVVRGRLLLCCYGSGGVRRHILSSHDGPYSVPAGTEHRFVAMDSNTIAYEFYIAIPGDPIDPSDIVRCDRGGIAVGDLDEFISQVLE